MGKSGHVAKKISATMASLGTASFYLHPGEAAHGDLGMVQKNDVVIMISKSGETDELIQLLNSLKIIGCKLIGIFCEKDSTLEKQCDLSIVLPMEKEACINNLAPTTSTTLTMAVGDAIAVALSQKKQFGRQEFALFHPRGTLGKQLLLTVGKIADNDLEHIAIHGDDEIKKVLWMITKNRLGAVTVVDKVGKLIGLVSDGDIRRAIEKSNDIWTMKAADIMTVNPINVKGETLVVDAFKMMQGKKISVLPVTNDDGILTGLVSFHDIIESGIVGGK
jgi:arabinose-5-phosphate isomerase